MPLNPSLPPHFTPIHNSLNGAGFLTCLLISTNSRNVFLIASATSCSSLCDCCCSKINTGLSNLGLRVFISSKSPGSANAGNPNLIPLCLLHWGDQHKQQEVC